MASDRQYARRSGLISVDRPGIGRSDPQPGRTIGDWTREVAGLLDLIEVERFAVLGWSMGGQYAAAVGHALPHRVTRVAIIAGALRSGFESWDSRRARHRRCTGG